MAPQDNIQISKLEVLHTLHGVLERDNSLSRCCAVRALARLNANDDETGSRLVKGMLDPDPDVRMDAAVALGDLRIEAATDILLEDMEQDPEGDVRVEAVKALAKIRAPKSVERLIRCLKKNGYPHLDEMVDDLEFSSCWEVQGQALIALGEIGDPLATEAVIELLQDDEYSDLQETGFQVLTRLGDERGKVFLLQQLNKGDKLAKRRAAQALADTVQQSKDGYQMSEDLLNGLLLALTDSEPSVRISAARALVLSGNPMITVSLTLLLNDPDQEVRGEVSKLLGRVKGREIVDRLHQLIDEPNAGHRKQIIKVLGEIGDPASVAPISALLSSEDSDLLYEVICALGQIGLHGPENDLAEVLLNAKHHASLRIQAASALGRILKQSSIESDAVVGDQNLSVSAKDNSPVSDGQNALSPQEVLAASVFDENVQVAFAALSALVETNLDAAADRLTAILGSTRREDEQQLVDNIDDDKGAVETFPRSEKAPPPEIQEMLVGHDVTTSTLASILATPGVQDKTGPKITQQNPNNQITQQASPHHEIEVLSVRLLGGLVDPGDRAMDVLIGLTASSDIELRKEALTALGRIGDPEALPVLLSALDASQVEFRQAAVEALGNLRGCTGFEQRLAQMFDDPDPMIRQRSIQILGESGSELAQQQLKRMLDDEDLEVCRAALRIINKGMGNDNGNSKLIDRVVELLFKFSGELRNDAAQTLTRLNASRAVSRLMDALDDMQQEEFHWVCIDALAEMYADNSVNPMATKT